MRNRDLLNDYPKQRNRKVASNRSLRLGGPVRSSLSGPAQGSGLLLGSLTLVLVQSLSVLGGTGSSSIPFEERDQPCGKMNCSNTRGFSHWLLAASLLFVLVAGAAAESVRTQTIINFKLRFKSITREKISLNIFLSRQINKFATAPLNSIQLSNYKRFRVINDTFKHYLSPFRRK